MMSYYLNLFLRYLKIERSYSEHTIAAYKHDLMIFNCKSEIGQLKVLLKSFYLSLVSQKYSVRSIRRKKYALKSFLNYLILQDIVSENILNDFTIPKLESNLPKLLKKSEVISLFAALDLHDKTYVRDKAILELLYGAGLRVSELCQLSVSNLFLNRSVCRICGKGNHWRDVVLGDLIVKSLKDYIKIRQKWLKGYDVNTLFIHPNTKSLSRQWVYLFLNKLSAKASLATKVSPHMLRHSFASHLLEGGASVKDVSSLLGHRELSSTQIYTHVSTSEIKKRYFASHPRL